MARQCEIKRGQFRTALLAEELREQCTRLQQDPECIVDRPDKRRTMRIDHREGFYNVLVAQRLESVQHIMRQTNTVSAHTYIQTKTDHPGLGRHYDAMNVLYIQIEGYTRWQVDPDVDEILEPGDTIYIPARVFHKVIALTPRIGLSLGYA